MNLRDRFKRSFKLRFAILYPFGTVFVLFANCDDKSIRTSIGFVIVGLFLRSWANGYIIKTDKLTTSGPYAFLRHPLYLGTMLIAMGFVVMLKMYFVGSLLIATMILVYYRTIKKEEAMLEEKFKNVYMDYKRKVPAILPTIFPYRKGEKWRFSFRRYIKSKEYKLILWMGILTIAFHLKEEFMVEHEKFNTKIIGLLIAAFILGGIDLIGELSKGIYKRSAK